MPINLSSQKLGGVELHLWITTQEFFPPVHVWMQFAHHGKFKLAVAE
jgi:hypothetical protein